MKASFKLFLQKNAKFLSAWGLRPQAPVPPAEAGGLGAKTPALKNFAFFCKINLILGLF